MRWPKCYIIRQINFVSIQIRSKEFSFSKTIGCARFYANGLVGIILEWVYSEYQHSANYMAEQLMIIMEEISSMEYKTISHVTL